MRLATYADFGQAVTYRVAQPAAKVALGPLYPLFKVGELGLGAVERKVTGGRDTGAKAAAFQVYSLDATGFVRNALSGFRGKKRSYSDIATEVNAASKACWSGACSREHVATLLQSDASGLPFLLADYDVIGSKRQIDARLRAEQDAPEGLREQGLKRARAFIQNPSTLRAFNDAQLQWFAPIAARLRG